MQEEKGFLILSSITLNFITMWHILLSCKDWIRKWESGLHAFGANQTRSAMYQMPATAEQGE